MNKILFGILVGIWLSVLAGFTSTAAWIGLSILGAGLAVGAGLVKVLLDAGLSPDAADGEGRALLTLTRDEGVAAALLDAGADPDARDVEGRTPLTYASEKGLRHVELLLAAGADAHASDAGGITVADYFPAEGPLRNLLEQHAGGRSLPPPRRFEVIDRGRTDWLLSGREPGAADAPSAVTIRPEELHYGDLATLDIRLGNDTAQDRLLQVSAVLNNAAFFVGASHNGRVGNPRVAGIAQAIRWPPLSLPVGREGRLALDIVARADEEAGDLSVDVRYRTVGETEDEVVSITETLGQGNLVPVPMSLATIVVPLAFVIGAYLAYRVLVRTKRKNVRAVSAVVVPIGAVASALVVVFLVAALVEPWIAFEETACEVLDRRVRLETIRPGPSRPGAAVQGRKSWSAGAVIERAERDKSSTLGIIFTHFWPTEFLYLGVGIGRKDPGEEKENTLRGTIGYEFELGKGWSISPQANVDFIENEDTEEVYGLVFAKRF